MPALSTCPAPVLEPAPQLPVTTCYCPHSDQVSFEGGPDISGSKQCRRRDLPTQARDQSMKETGLSMVQADSHAGYMKCQLHVVSNSRCSQLRKESVHYIHQNAGLATEPCRVPFEMPIVLLQLHFPHRTKVSCSTELWGWTRTTTAGLPFFRSRLNMILNLSY